jgi:hypothetical protein
MRDVEKATVYSTLLRCVMRDHVPKHELLRVMKDCLRDLENVKVLSPDDLSIIDQKRTLRQTIVELERDEGQAA